MHVSVGGWLRTDGATVTPEKKIQDQGKGDEREAEEERTTLAVHPRMDHMGANLDAEFADYKDTESIPNQGKGQHDQGKDGSRPRRTQKHLSGNQTGEEERERGTDAAAFGRDLHLKARERKGVAPAAR